MSLNGMGAMSKPISLGANKQTQGLEVKRLESSLLQEGTSHLWFRRTEVRASHDLES